MRKNCRRCGREFDAPPSGPVFCGRACSSLGRRNPSGGQKLHFRGTFEERLDRYTKRTEKCWIWQGKLHDGYGVIAEPKVGPERPKMIRAHRAMYERLVGPVPEGLDLDHLCRNRACVNPAHLEPVTRSVNLRRGAQVNAVDERETHCPRGHEYTAENTYIWAREPAKPRCVTCARERKAARRTRAA